MHVFTPLLLAWALCGVRGVIRTPLEAFRPSGEIHLRRPDKLPFLPHKRIPVPSKSDVKILYQTGVSLVLVISLALRKQRCRTFATLKRIYIPIRVSKNKVKITI